jgi:cyclase
MDERRIIPILQMENGRFIKTKNYDLQDKTYIGDPINTLRIFNEFQIDEVIILDILASKLNSINLKLLKEISTECFMPLTYGGGIQNLKDAELIISIGFEKISFNSQCLRNPTLVSEVVKSLGSQAVVCSIDYGWFDGDYRVFDHLSRKFTSTKLEEHFLRCTDLGCGELVITNIQREGSWEGYDIDGIKKICDLSSVPIIANGGAVNQTDVQAVFELSVDAGVSSSVLFLKNQSGVLINFPFNQRKQLEFNFNE